MAMNTAHFKDGLNKVWSTLRTSAEHEKVIIKAKEQLLSLFDDDTAGIESHEDMNKALDHVADLVVSKEKNARREDMKEKWLTLEPFVTSLKSNYNNVSFQKTEFKNDAPDKKIIDQLQWLYKKIQNIASQSSTTVQEQKTPLLWENTTEPTIQDKSDWSKQIDFQELLQQIDHNKNPIVKDRLGVEYVLSKQGEDYFTALADGSSPQDKISRDALEQQFGDTKDNKIVKWWTQQVSKQDEVREIIGTGEKGWYKRILDVEDIDYEIIDDENNKTDELDILLLKTKFLRELLELEEKIDKKWYAENKEQLKREYQQLRINRDALSSIVKESIKNPQSDTEHALKKVNDRIVKKLYTTFPDQKLLPTPDDIKLLPEPKIKDNPENILPITPNIDNIIHPVQKELIDIFSIDANLMDKENLVYEAERNRIRDKSERDYESANWFEKAKMFGLDRRNQRKDLRDSMEAATTNSNFIESGTLQERIEGNIGTYDKQDAMNIGGRNINEEKSELGTDARINNIAHLYMTGTLSQADAVAQFNIVFADLYSSREDIQELGSMTGTDLMAKLNNPASKRTYRIRQAIIGAIDDPKTESISADQLQAIQTQYTTYLNQAGEKNETLTADMITREFESLKTDKIIDSIDKLDANTANIKIKLRGITKIPWTEELEGVRYDNLDKWFVAWLSKITNKLGLPGNIAAKIALWGVITLAWGAPLFALVGVTGLGVILQYLKTYRDSTREIAKTHEDAINLGMNELQDRITNLETSIADAGNFAKVGAWFWWNALHRQRKQKDILLALQEMRNTDALVSVDSLIGNLNTSQGHSRATVLASTLARIDAWHDLDTQFISTTRINGSGYGREQTAIKRNELMESVRQKALITPLIRMGIYDINGRPVTVAVSENSTPEQRQIYRDELKQLTSYTSTYNRLEHTYHTVQSDIKTTRRKLGGQASGNYLKNVAAAAIVTWGVKVGIDYFQNNNWTETASAIQWTSVDQEASQHANFKLSGHDINAWDPSLTNQWSLADGTHVQNMQAEVSVDAVAAKAGSFADYAPKVSEVQSYISSAGLDPTTTKAFQEALSEDYLEKVMTIGADASADIGNQKLLVLRWSEMIEKTAEYLKDNNLTNVKIDKVEFVDMANNMSIQKSIVGGTANAAHRGFEVLLQGTHITDGTPAQYSFNWPNPWLYGANLPFFNTYAKTGKKQPTEQVPFGPWFQKTPPPEKRKSKWNLFGYSTEKKKKESKKAA